MASKPLPTSRTTFTAIPLDVLSHIALDTVYQSASPPTLRELNTVHSLVLTSRSINQKLSLRRNPHLYADIIRLMCDIDPVERRLGSRAVTASALASELPQRLTMLKRIRRRLSDIDHNGGDRLTNSADLAKLFMMTTEDDGKNRHQIGDILGPSGLADLCFNLLSRHSPFPEQNVSTPDLAFVVALMWLNSEGSYQVVVSVCMIRLEPQIRSCMRTQRSGPPSWITFNRWY
ncbi:hypothetical protein JB92DRAFT_2921257 [Gautieria morchelliformis]|nr:hypothetical protein JB92DRAFT_2921257 [Gautieria morchelliformis]